MHSSADGVLSAGQLRRHYRCTIKQLRQHKIKIATVPVTATRYATRVHKVRFATLEKRLLSLPGTGLRHLAGLAELRHQLEAQPETWSRSEGLSNGKGRPDALWQREDLKLAIEFDAGGYSEKKIVKKMLAFRAWSDEQVWGSASHTHARLIERCARKTFTPARVLVVDWLARLDP
jgi:hypothetical protein